MVSTTGDVILGDNRSNSGTTSGELNATEGTLNLSIDDVIVGRALSTGVASGTFTMGGESDVAADTISIGVGSAATGTFNMPDGTLNAGTITLETGAFNFTGGQLTVRTFNGNLAQDGGTLAPGVAKGSSDNDTTINGNYELASTGTVEFGLSGPSADSQVEQLFVNGAVNLDADGGGGGTLDVNLGFVPGLGTSFTIIDNDGTDPISGIFKDKPNGSQFTETANGSTVTFEIDYFAGDGNDVELTVTDVSPAPAPAALEVAEVEMLIDEDHDALLL
jgi:hypothetical protein